MLELPGLLEFSTDPDKSSRDALDACGAPYELLEPADVEARFSVNVPPGMTALFQPDAGVRSASVRSATRIEDPDTGEGIWEIVLEVKLPRRRRVRPLGS